MFADPRYSPNRFNSPTIIGPASPLLRPIGAPDSGVYRKPGTPGRSQRAQAQLSTISGARPNPLSDVPNWDTGGRKAPSATDTNGDMMLWYIGGAVLLAAVLMRRKK